MFHCAQTLNNYVLKIYLDFEANLDFIKRMRCDIYIKYILVGGKKVLFQK